MQRLLEQTLRRAVERGAQFDLLRDFDAVAQLDALAADVSSGGKAADPRDRTVRVGNVELRELSLGALAWLDEAAGWYRQPDRYADLCVCYAMAHSRDPQRLPSDLGSTNAAIDAWQRTVGATETELCAAAQSLLPAPAAAPAAASKDEPAPLATILDLLLSEYGGTPDQWLWQESFERIEALIHAMAQRPREGATVSAMNPMQARAFSAFTKAAREFVSSRMPASAAVAT